MELTFRTRTKDVRQNIVVVVAVVAAVPKLLVPKPTRRLPLRVPSLTNPNTRQRLTWMMSTKRTKTRTKLFR